MLSDLFYLIPCVVYLFSVSSGHLVSGVYHGRDGKGQRDLPGHWPYPSPLSLTLSPSIKPFILHKICHSSWSFLCPIVIPVGTFPSLYPPSIFCWIGRLKISRRSNFQWSTLCVSCPLWWLLIYVVLLLSRFLQIHFNWYRESNWTGSDHLHLYCPFLSF